MVSKCARFAKPCDDEIQRASGVSSFSQTRHAISGSQIMDYPKYFHRSILCLTVIAVQLVFPKTASACESLLIPPTIPEEFQNSSAVFLGKVTYVGFNYEPFASLLNEIYNKLYPPLLNYYTDKFSGVRVDFEVKSSWKYVSTIKISLRDHDVCGYGYKGFVLGQDYLIYAYLADNNLNSDLNINTFSRTLAAQYATEDLSYLKTQPSLLLTPVQDTGWIYGLGAIMFLLALWRVRRSRRLQ
jgi:hypothetical protein